MGKLIDLTGQVFVRWKVRGLSHKVGKTYFWDCVCDCGTERAVAGRDLSRGSSRSCGCLRNEELGERGFKHGMCNHPAYQSWKQARDRCRNPNKKGWKDYGGRGVVFSEKWDDFNKFWEDMGPTWKEGLSLDRWPNMDGNYEAGNCRWATPKEQANNRRTNIFLEDSEGNVYTLKQAAEREGIPYETVKSRLRYGWTLQEAFSKSLLGN